MIIIKKGMTYRTKLIIFFVSAIIITAFVGVYSYASSRILMKDITDLLDKSQDMTMLHSEIEQVQRITEEYLLTRSSDSLQSFYEYVNSISTHSDTLNSNADFNERDIKIINLTEMVNRYLKVLDDTIIAKRNNKVESYTAYYKEAVKQYTYIGDYIEGIMTSDLSESTKKYVELERESARTLTLNYMMFGITIVLVIIIIVLFSFEISKPITKLATYAKEISDGNFDVELPEENSSTEIGILYKAFAKMAVSIKNHINEIKEKQFLERTLIEEKIKNLTMNHSLKEAELRTLQSQVNPHFIFNTINIGANIAMLQGDEITREYLMNFADIMRYNLKGLELDATLEEEILNVKAYMSLLQTRFGDMIDFVYKGPEEQTMLDIVLPRMTLQPLVENAYIHGVAKVENGGIIKLEVEKEEDKVRVIISNTGPEIPRETISLILQGKYRDSQSKSKKTGHTTGIGINNVLSRLQLFFKTDKVMDIRYKDSMTQIILFLPTDNSIFRGGAKKDV